MTPTQQALADIRAEGKAVWDRASMVEMSRWVSLLEQASEAAYAAGECCGSLANGHCQSPAVRRLRAAKIEAAGVPAIKSRRICWMCERNPQYAAELAGALRSDGEAAAATAAEVWGLQFINLMEGQADGDCNHDERITNESEAAGGGDGQRAAAPKRAHQESA